MVIFFLGWEASKSNTFVEEELLSIVYLTYLQDSLYYGDINTVKYVISFSLFASYSNNNFIAALVSYIYYRVPIRQTSFSRYYI